MRDFVSFFISQIPIFLMTEPISAFTALAILFWVSSLVSRMMGISRSRR